MTFFEVDHTCALTESRTSGDNVAQLRLREQEERHAAAAAEDVTARKAHLGLARLYAEAATKAHGAKTDTTVSMPREAGSRSDNVAVNMDARVTVPNRDSEKGMAADIAEAEEQSIGRPRRRGKLALF